MGVGLHPWWVSRAVGSVPAEHAESLSTLVFQAVLAVRDERFVGEVGLDFSAAHAESRAQQIEAFDAVIRSCAEHPVAGRVISIHAVRAAGEALDVMQRYGLARQASCVFHWFSGTSDELARARAMGCWFSMGERMLATRRGREYARQIPVERLLIETDAPALLDTAYSAEEWVASLSRTIEQLAQIHGCDQEELARTVTQSSAVLLGL